MRAIVQDRYGEAEVLALRELPQPSPGRGEVLVRVRAAGVDRGTWHLMAGLPLVVRLGTGVRRPRQPVLGRDLAGTVEAVGDGVTRFAPGDEVFGTGPGALAEYAIAREDRLARKPRSLGYAEAAAVPVSALTALQAVRNVGRVRAGQQVLVIGASGGVGSFAVQLAVADGATVTAMCSPGKADLVRKLGATEVLDYAGPDPATRFDLVLDIGGNRPLRRLRRLLTRNGTLVIVGGEGGGRWFGGLHRQLGAVLLSPFVRQRLTFFVSKENAEDLTTIADLVDQGAVIPALERTWPLEQAAEAVRRLRSGQVRGKVAVVVGPEAGA